MKYIIKNRFSNEVIFEMETYPDRGSDLPVEQVWRNPLRKCDSYRFHQSAG